MMTSIPLSPYSRQALAVWEEEEADKRSHPTFSQEHVRKFLDALCTLPPLTDAQKEELRQDDLHRPQAENSWTPLQHAMDAMMVEKHFSCDNSKFHKDGVGMLLKRRGDINARDAKGNTQVLNAARSECSMLIQAGCDEHAVDNNSKGAVQQTMRRLRQKASPETYSQKSGLT